MELQKHEIKWQQRLFPVKLLGTLHEPTEKGVMVAERRYNVDQVGNIFCWTVSFNQYLDY